MKKLKDLPEDRTFCQTLSFDGNLPAYHSLDLTNATDRFPIGFQKVVLEKIFGREYSEE